MHCMHVHAAAAHQKTRVFSMLSMHTAGTAGAAANGTPCGAAARNRCGEPGVLRISGIFWNSGRPHAPGGPMQGPPCRAARERGARCVTDIWYCEIPGGHTRGPQGPQDRQRDRNRQDFRLDLKLSWPPPIRATWVGASGQEIWLPRRVSAKAFPERIRPKSGPGKLLRIRPDMVDYSGRMCMTLQNKPNLTKDTRHATAKRRKTMPSDSGSVPACFDHGPKLFNCEIAQPRMKGAATWTP